MTRLDDPCAARWFCWRLAGAQGPCIGQALLLGEATRAAVMRAGNRHGLTRLPDTLHGDAKTRGHRHAFWLPEDRDGDGFIDHVSLYAPGGLPHTMLPALDDAGPVWIDRTWSLVPASPGATDLARLVGPSRRWQAVTAYVTPLWRLDRDTQLRRELAQRGLPEPVSVVWGAIASAPGFICRTRMRAPPRDMRLGMPELLFRDPVAGPMAFGFGAHFGLGLLMAAEQTPPPTLRP